jgi:hypothetical protein
MTDASREVEARYRERLLALSAAARLEMASRMFSTAQALAVAGLVLESGSPVTTRERLFRRLYGNDFTEEEADRIAAHLRAA